MNWIQDMNKCTGPAAPIVGPVVEVRGMLANGVQIPLAVRGVYELRDGKTGVFVTMPEGDEAHRAIYEAEAAQLTGPLRTQIAELRAVASRGGHLAAASAEIERLRAAMAPFAELVNTTNGRIPHERLSAADWHALAKAYGA